LRERCGTLAGAGSVSGSVYYTGSNDEDDEATNIYLHDDAVVITGVSNVTNREYKTILYDMDFGTLDVCSELQGPTLYTVNGYVFTSDETTILPLPSDNNIHLNAGDEIKISIRANNTWNLFDNYSVDVKAQYTSTTCKPLTVPQANFTEISAVNGPVTFGHTFTHTFEGYPLNASNVYYNGSKSITVELSNPLNGNLGDVTCVEVIVDFTTDLKNESFEKQINVFPTIANDYITLSNKNFSIPFENISIYGVNGNLIRSFNQLTSNKINVENLSSGYYTLKLSNNNNVITRKFIKK